MLVGSRYRADGRVAQAVWHILPPYTRFLIEQSKACDPMPGSIYYPTYIDPVLQQAGNVLALLPCDLSKVPPSVSVSIRHTHTQRAFLQERTAPAASSAQLGDELILRGQALAGCGYAFPGDRCRLIPDCTV